MSEAAMEVLATQIPLAALFALCAFGLFVMVLRFIKDEREASREERKSFLKALEDITDELKIVRRATEKGK